MRFHFAVRPSVGPSISMEIEKPTISGAINSKATLGFSLGHPSDVP